MENTQPLNTVFISSRHYADLVESETILNILRDILIDRLKIYDYSGKPEMDFNASDFENVVKTMFPDQYAKRSSALIADWYKKHPDKATNAE